MESTIQHIILRSLRGELSAEDQQVLDAWLADAEENRALLEELNDPAQVARSMDLLSRMDPKEAYTRMRTLYPDTMHMESSRQAPVRSLKKYRWWAAAAVVILLAGAATIWRLQSPGGKTENVGPAQALQDLPPGGNKAILTLSGGRQIILDSAHLGAIAEQGGARISKTDSGRLAYRTENEKPSEILYNTLSTPRGGQYQLTLPDGTKVWLNAASSITYPTAFTGTDRKVTITGEAYFEVAKDKTKPFRVTVGQVLVDVLATSFNVNSYSDEPVMKVTLLIGKVQVQKERGKVLLQAGQQAVVSAQVTPAGRVDTAAVMAWKNGLFSFEGADLQTVLRQLARWYDLDIRYQDGAPSGTLTGDVPRNLNLSEVLKVMALSGVHCQLTGRVLTVTN